nr:MAG TPA: hypothetical protein [Caudoviricetes sp.]
MGVSVQKKLGILHLQNGAGYANEKPTPLLIKYYYAMR